MINVFTLRDKPELIDTASQWFSSKWGVPAEAYYECMSDFISVETEYGREFYCTAQGDGEEKPSRMYIHR